MKTLLFLLVFFFSAISFAQDTVIKAMDPVQQFYSLQQINIDTLHSQYLYYKAFDWIGTKYKYAGESKKGIDCSGFASTVYNDVYCIKLEGGSGDIYKSTTPVKKENLKEGDLVFFKIKRGKISHVGIYLANNKFVHASVHSGVVISSLEEPYYKKYFFSGGRLIFD
jgi:lipoprotein Spr